MKLGISSLSHLISVAMQSQNPDIHKILLQATRSCLQFSETHQLEVCELILDPPTILDPDKKAEFINLCKEFSIPKQIHATFVDVSLCSFNQAISDTTLDIYRNNAEITKAIGASTLTFHPGISDLPVPSLKSKNREILLDQLQKLLAFPETIDIKMCMENMPKESGFMANAKEMFSIYQDLNNPNLHFTYDTSHLWTNDGDYSELIELLHPYIKNVHLADNLDKNHDLHPSIGTGNVPFPKIIKKLKEYNYKDALIIEVLDVRQLDASIDYIQKHL